MAQNAPDPCLNPAVKDQLDRITTSVNRILELQKIDDLTSGENLFLRSTESNTCSAASTGGCHIEGRALTSAD